MLANQLAGYSIYTKALCDIPRIQGIVSQVGLDRLVTLDYILICAIIRYSSSSNNYINLIFAIIDKRAAAKIY
jgi:hypothetical protein